MERPEGKKRAETVQSFATHVTLRKAMGDDAPELESHPPQALPAPTEASPTPDAPEPPREARDSKMSSLLLPVAGGAALLVAGVLFFVDGSNGGSNTQPAASIDAAILAPSDAAPATRGDAAVEALQATPDAGHALKKKDAGSATIRRRSDARAEKAMGSIRVGANPWADVFLDGKAIGRAPGNFEVPAGAHSLELRFRDKSKTIQIDVKPSQLTSLGVVDFTD
jgi:hypothetical protein